MNTRQHHRISVLRLCVVLLCLAAEMACGPRLSAGASEILRRLGPVSGFMGNGCPAGDSSGKLMDVYMAEIGRRPSEPLNVTVPKFARRAAGICPQSKNTILVKTPMDVSQARDLLHLPPPATDTALELEPWLRANVEAGKVVSLTVDLARLSR